MSKNRFSSGLPEITVFVAVSLLTTTACSSRPLAPASAAVVPSAKSDTATSARVSESYGKLPLHFEANQGQTDQRVKFLSRGAGHTLFLTSTEAVVVLTKSEPREARDALKPARKAERRANVTRTVLRTTLVGANPESRVDGQDELVGKANYFIGNDPAKWRAGVPTYATVRYTNVYPGIDLVYYGNQRQLEYDFVVRPGADPTPILLAFQGADKLEVDAQGDLVLHTATGTIRQRKPFIYQEVDGARREISGGYMLKGAGRVGFRVAAYDSSWPLIIDPALFYSTYLGGSSFDSGFGIAVDASGNGYVTGQTNSTNFPTTMGTFQTTLDGSLDAFVAKLDPTGSALVYSTYLGGSSFDSGSGIAVDASGNVYVLGATDSTNFPTTMGAFQTTLDGSFDAFVTKLDPTGSALVYSTYLGGSDSECCAGSIAIDALGNAYVTGSTDSSDFPTTLAAFQTTLGGSPDAFVTKLDPTGAALVYSTYLGGSVREQSFGIALDASGNAYVTGETDSSNFPITTGAFQTTSGGSGDTFVTKLNPTGAALVYSTYLGGNDFEQGGGIAVDTPGNAYVTGATQSADFPTTAGAFQTTNPGTLVAFVTKLDPTGTALVYSTYLGGIGFSESFGIATDAAGNAYVTGGAGADFPTTAGAFQTTFGGGVDAFVTKLNPTGAALVYSTYLGGNGEEEGVRIALDALPSPNAYVTGFTYSANLPTTAGAFQTTFGDGSDAFVAQITEAEVPSGPFTARVTGGGTIDVAGGIANFHFIIQRQTDGTLSGRLQYFNHASGARVRSETYTTLVIVGNTATFDGTCTLNGSPCTFRVDVTDNGEPGTTDTFAISVNLGPLEGGTLRSGNIQITQ
jgi:hypothetical protein